MNKLKSILWNPQGQVTHTNSKQLPNEIWLQILSFTNLKSISRLKQTSRGMRDLIEHNQATLLKSLPLKDLLWSAAHHATPQSVLNTLLKSQIQLVVAMAASNSKTNTAEILGICKENIEALVGLLYNQKLANKVNEHFQFPQDNLDIQQAQQVHTGNINALQRLLRQPDITDINLLLASKLLFSNQYLRKELPTRHVPVYTTSAMMVSLSTAPSVPRVEDVERHQTQGAQHIAQRVANAPRLQPYFYEKSPQVIKKEIAKTIQDDDAALVLIQHTSDKQVCNALIKNDSISKDIKNQINQRSSKWFK